MRPSAASRAANAGKILAQRFRCDEDAPLVGGVRDDGGGNTFFHEREPAGGRASLGEARMVEGGGRNAEQQAGREEEQIGFIHGAYNSFSGTNVTKTKAAPQRFGYNRC